VVVWTATGAAAGALGELDAGCGVLETAAGVLAPPLDALSAGVEVPVALSQPAVRTRRATNTPRNPPK
jgi:hypothetical protein